MVIYSVSLSLSSTLLSPWEDVLENGVYHGVEPEELGAEGEELPADELVEQPEAPDDRELVQPRAEEVAIGVPATG